MLNTNYSVENYNEDLKLINFMLFKKFNKKQFEDLEQTIQDCLFDLYQARQLFDSFKSKYSSFACKVIHNFLLNKLRHDSYVNSALKGGFLSLDNDIEGVFLSNLIGEEMHVNEIGLLDLIKKILSNLENTKYKKACIYFIQGYHDVEIVSKLKVSKQFISKCRQKFRAELRKELAKVGYEI